MYISQMHHALLVQIYEASMKDPSMANTNHAIPGAWGASPAVAWSL